MRKWGYLAIIISDFLQMKRLRVQGFPQLAVAVILMTGGTCWGEIPMIRIGPGTPVTEVSTNIVRLVFEPRFQPDAMAILVNTTNEWPTLGTAELPGAQWLPFQLEQVLTLNPQTKRHSISVGF